MFVEILRVLFLMARKWLFKLNLTNYIRHAMISVRSGIRFPALYATYICQDPNLEFFFHFLIIYTTKNNNNNNRI